jgi:Flp pilus assembly pilin Flp
MTHLSSGPGSRGSPGSRDRSRGQGLVEYGLILLLIVTACVVSLLFFGDQLSSLLSLIATQV